MIRLIMEVAVTRYSAHVTIDGRMKWIDLSNARTWNIMYHETIFGNIGNDQEDKTTVEDAIEDVANKILIFL